jgi:predicted O-methyltransferase YrrM
MTSLTDWIARLFENPELLRMGHGQRQADLNLGLGWVYYGLARAIRPKVAVVIGSYRGFVPAVLARALAENSEGGEVVFIDPSMVDDFWKDAGRVREHFSAMGLTNVRHYLMTTQQFVESEAYQKVGEVGLLFVDGYHSEEQASFDFSAFRDRLIPDGIALFHDSIRVRLTRLYGEGRHYEHRVKCFMDKLKLDPEWQVFDLPLADGVTLVRRA